MSAAPSAAHRSRPLRGSVAVGALVVAALGGTLLAPPASSAADAQAVDTPRVRDIQGSTRLSPYVGAQVTNVSGIVTGVRAYGSRGFWLQDPEADGSAATSEGIFVFTSSTPRVAVGDDVLVSGTVGEFYYGGVASGGQSVTQISRPTVTVRSSGNELPAPVVLDADTLPRAYAPAGDPAADDSVEGLELAPDTYALDLYESLEGMNVTIGDAPVVGPSTSFYELWVTLDPERNRTASGGSRYASYTEQNPGRLKIEALVPVAQQPFPTANVGDVLTGPTEGPLDYDEFGGYVLAARALGEVTPGDLEPETTRPQRADELAVATYNVENLHPGNAQEKFDRLAAGVVEHLASPDILALEEIQDNNGPTNDGTVAADQTLQRFTDAVVAAGGPRYEWRSIDPVDGQDGGQPGGNIRNVFLFNPERVSFTDRAGGDATTPTGVVKERGRARLTLSPGRIDPANAAWEDSRKPLAAEFTFRGETVIVVANHFASKGGDQPLYGRYQPPARSSEDQRLRQAQAVNDFVREVRSAQRTARVVVLGDINDFEFSATTEALTAGGALESAVTSLPRDERYTYVFQGNSQVLDQTLVSPAIRRYDYDIVHINAEFADQASDHDPQVLRFRP
ncbi:endonuclease/exonuclease/phosphatase family protein [Streptomyces sp. NBC_01803]|uniref:endonuclease/exonuclease/phosphatase family protein n=1 Tax=Streptomyces sp. NBC_01803 TaxID=2975946 RepID=UPI002DD8CECB|nr:endonuclease/exonuclease/phosphatase family protein [Streptomyces sp. NBC_01803]WSA46794.1 endonuclease/exonuclease/phosphatase family protein [Streptomyces sp. NBC_01803]